MKDGEKRDKKISDHHLDFQICEGAVFFPGESSAVVTTDFEISSASEPGKFKISEDSNGSLAALDTLALFDRYPPPPKSTCKCASRRSRPKMDNA